MQLQRLRWPLAISLKVARSTFVKVDISTFVHRLPHDRALLTPPRTTLLLGGLGVGGVTGSGGEGDRNVQWFRGGLVFQAYRRLYH